MGNSDKDALREYVPGIYRAVGRVQLAGPFTTRGAMHVVRAEDALVLIDPFRLSSEDLEKLEAIGRPTHVIICGPTHVRHTAFYRDRYGVRVMTNRKLLSKIEIGIDAFFEEDEMLPGGLKTIEMSGTFLGETALLHEADGVLIMGDPIFNLQDEDLDLPMKLAKPFGQIPMGLSTMPKFVMADKALAAESYRKLLDYPFDKIFMSHGQPVLSDGKEKLRTLVASL